MRPVAIVNCRCLAWAGRASAFAVCFARQALACSDFACHFGRGGMYAPLRSGSSPSSSCRAPRLLCFLVRRTSPGLVLVLLLGSCRVRLVLALLLGSSRVRLVLALLLAGLAVQARSRAALRPARSALKEIRHPELARSCKSVFFGSLLMRVRFVRVAATIEASERGARSGGRGGGNGGDGIKHSDHEGS